jgi:hypothetical protein
MVTLAGALGVFPFPRTPPVNRSKISWRQLTSLSKERNLSRRYAAFACS